MQQDEFRLELKIEATDYGYMVRARTSGYYPDSAPFEFTVTRRELTDLHNAMRAACASDAFRLALMQELVQDWGGRLFDAVFRDDVLERYRIAKREADAAGRELRVQLDLTDMEELAVFPWEFLYDRGRQEYVGLAAGTLFTRYASFMHQLRPPQRSGPLRVLVVIPSPEGHAEIDVQRSWLGLLDQVDHLAREQKLVVEWLQKPTLFDLRQQLRSNEYHVLHYMGHSMVCAETGEGQLVFEDEMGRGRAVGGEHLGSLLRDHFSMRLVLITGGVSAGRAHGRTVGSSYGVLDVAGMLVKRSMGAVLATPFNMPSDESSRYLSQFYSELADTMPVDRAAVRARIALRDRSIWWGAPILYSRAPTGNLFGEFKTELEQLTDDAVDNIAFRLSALRIRTATPEAMARWNDELTESRLRRRIERD
ncbi:MAG: CHAT domain-containing protein [Caldilineaceae bacterium]